MTIKINELEYAANVPKQLIRKKETGPMLNEMTRDEMTEEEKYQDTLLMEQAFENFSNKFPEIITPKKFQEITGGLMSEKDLAMLHFEGCAIEPRMRIAGRICYLKETVIMWLADHMEIDRRVS
jgi:hypothetical protein